MDLWLFVLSGWTLCSFIGSLAAIAVYKLSKYIIKQMRKK